MGTMNFLLPGQPEPDAAKELGRACVVGGPDSMPWPTEIRLDRQQLVAWRAVNESGCLAVPWEVDGHGRLMVSTATLMERDGQYDLSLELARGKINQLRCQAADWQLGGLQVDAGLAGKIRDAGLAFAKAVGQPNDFDHLRHALGQAVQTGSDLVAAYVAQVFQARHHRQPQLPTSLGVRLTSTRPSPVQTGLLRQTFNSVRIPFSWPEVEPEEAVFRWDECDGLVQWARENEFTITAGPLIDFSRSRLPNWLWLWERDLQSIANFMCDFLETTIQRYRKDVRVWEISMGSNWASILALEEDEMLWLTTRLLEAARQVDAKLELVVGIAQPWGEYLAQEDRAHSPFIFADTLLRSGVQVSAFDLELIMGVQPRGSYPRDQLETSRLLDLYALLGLPLRVTLGCPAASGPASLADPAYQVIARPGQQEWSPALQAQWAERYAALAACKPYVVGIDWVHLSDAEPHQFPHCGLVDAQHTPRPALEKLSQLRAQHLR
jgi:hypothetical protein